MAPPSPLRPPLLLVGQGDAHLRCLQRDERRARLNTVLTLALLLVWLWLGVRTFQIEAALQGAAPGVCSAVSGRNEPVAPAAPQP
jgi:hypothetical protein